MKKLLALFTITVMLFVAGCSKFDDSEIWNSLHGLESRVAKLEELCKQMNTNISSLQTIVTALQTNDYITGVTPVTSGDETVGYTITFAKSPSITIYHGQDGKDGINGTNGKDGHTPVIGVRQDSDNAYYWTLDGEWLLDTAGNKIKAEGRDGQNGKDGITPQLKIENGYWYVSTDNGATWTNLGKATGEDGKDGASSGDSIFQSVTQDDENVYFTLADGSVITISKTKQQTDADAIEFVDGNVKLICVVNWDTNKDGELSYEEAKAVTSIGNKFTCSKIISFEEFQYFTGVTSLNANAFCDCPSLARIVLPDGLKIIGENAFTGCINLAEISFPASVTTIKDEAFMSCSTLISVTVPQTVTSIGGGVFALCENLTSFRGPYASEDGRCLISDGTLRAFAPKEITEYSIPEGVKSIATYAFAGCGRLKSITFPSSVESIAPSAIYYCERLSTIRFMGENPPALDDGTFSTYGNYTIYVPDTAIQAYMDSDWPNEYKGHIASSQITDDYIIRYTTSDNEMIGLDHSRSVDYFGVELIAHTYSDGEGLIIFAGQPTKFSYYWGNSLTSITIPDSVTSIGASAFYGCSGLTSITIPDSVTSIGASAFSGCSGLTSITIPDSVTSIGASAFYGCSGLTSVTIGNSVTSIGDSAFSGCSGLTSITIPDSVTSIGDSAFSGCSGLTSITIPDSVTSIGRSAFEDCTGECIINCNIPYAAISYYSYCNAVFYNSKFSKIIIGDSVTSIGNYAFAGCSGLTSVTIGDSVTSIGNYAFAGCSGLTSVTIGNSVTSIGVQAFEYCSGLTSVTIGNSVTSIGDYAFEYCSGLTSITIPDSVTSIGDSAFFGCSGLTSITIPDSVTSIGRYAFEYCSGLTSITIPDSVTSIGDSAFKNCSSLTSIYCKAQIPPIMSDYDYSAFDKIILYVPIGCKNAYATANRWKYAKEIIEMEF